MAREIEGGPVDDNIPEPAPISRHNKYMEVVKKMKRGESFVVFGDHDMNSVRNATRLPTRDEGKVFTIRKEGDGFYRIWRLK